VSKRDRLAVDPIPPWKEFATKRWPLNKSRERYCALSVAKPAVPKTPVGIDFVGNSEISSFC
jgi:hypothetical protein